MKCEDCPVQAAYAQYVIERDIQPDEVTYGEIFSQLALMDQKKLSAMTEASEENRRSLNASGCPGGPRKTFFGLGQKVCQANLTFFTDESPIV